MAAKFGVFVDEDHSNLHTVYWSPKFHKIPYESRSIATFGSGTTTELSKVLTS